MNNSAHSVPLVGADFIGKKGDLFGEEDELGLNHCVFTERDFFSQRLIGTLCLILLDEPVKFVMMPSCRNDSIVSKVSVQKAMLD